MPVPGEVMFSDEWMIRNGKNIPNEYRPLCRAICKDHGIGNDNSMEMVWLTVRDHVAMIESRSWNSGYEDGYRRKEEEAHEG